MENVLPNMFEFTTDDLLKNLPFSSVKCSPFKLHHYVQLKLLSNGVIDKCIDKIEELEKFNFKIDPERRSISNVLDYEFVVIDHDLSTVHIINAETRKKIGHLNVSLQQNDPNILSISATLT